MVGSWRIRGFYHEKIADMRIKIIKRVKKSTSKNYFEPGTKISVSEEYGERLIREGYAVKEGDKNALLHVLQERLYNKAKLFNQEEE